jgi:hypothetical protein
VLVTGALVLVGPDPIADHPRDDTSGDGLKVIHGTTQILTNRVAVDEMVSDIACRTHGSAAVGYVLVNETRHGSVDRLRPYVVKEGLDHCGLGTVDPPRDCELIDVSLPPVDSLLDSR